MKLREEHQIKLARWQPIIASWIESGLTAKSYCEKHSLNKAQFRYWQYQIAPESKKGSKRKTVTKLFSEVKPSISLPVPSTGFELLTPRGYCLKIPPCFDTSSLIELMKVLGAVAC